MKKIHYLIFFIFLALSMGFIPVNGMSGQSLEWQKIELEKTIKSEIMSTISPVLRSGEFIVHVNVKIKPVPALNPASADGSPGKTPEEIEREKEKAKELEKEKEKEAKRRENKKPSIRFNDIDPKEAPGDYVVLAKLGLEAPLYNDEVLPQQIAPLEPVSPAKDESKSEAKQWQKFISEYLQNYDLFKIIESVNIDIKLDEYLGDATKKTVENLINGMNLEFGQVKVQVNTSYITMKEIKKELNKKKPEPMFDLYKWFGKAGLPVAIIIAVFLFGAFAFMLFKKYAALQEKQMDMMREQMNQQKPLAAEKDKKEDEDESTKKQMLNSQDSDDKEDGIERFKSLVHSDLVEACLIIKKWINDPSKLHQNVLNVLVKEIPGDDLAKIFEHLSMDERKSWKKYIGKNLKSDEVLSAKRYIGAQVVQEMIMPNSISDAETVDLLIRIKPEESVALCKEVPALGAILMNVMNAKFISRMMDKMEEGLIQSLLQESLHVTSDSINVTLGEFKILLKKHIHSEEVSPFLEKLMELIPLSTPLRERTLYEGLARAASPEKLLEVARNYFPAELVFKIPDSLMKNFVQNYSREKRPELVLVMDEGPLKTQFIDTIAPNLKSKDMLNLELERLERNEVVKNRLMENKEVVMKEFVDHCRKQIRSNPVYLKDLEPVLSEWLGGFSAPRATIRVVSDAA